MLALRKFDMLLCYFHTRRGCSVDRKEIEYREKIKTPDK